MTLIAFQRSIPAILSLYFVSANSHFEHDTVSTIAIYTSISISLEEYAHSLSYHARILKNYTPSQHKHTNSLKRMGGYLRIEFKASFGIDYRTVRVSLKVAAHELILLYM